MSGKTSCRNPVMNAWINRINTKRISRVQQTSAYNKREKRKGKVMAHLKCVKHNQRVMVLDIGTDGFLIPLTVHRNGGKQNDICDSRTVTIDKERFTPQMVIDNDWSDSEMTPA